MKILLILLVILFTSLKSAFSISCDGVKENEWQPVSAGPVTTWTAPVCKKGKINIQPFFFYNRTRSTFDTKGHYKSYKNKDTKSQWQQQLFVQYGVTNNLELGAQGVYQENLRRIQGHSAEANGFGDSYIYARYCVVEEKLWVPHITGLFQLKLATGKYQKLDAGKLGTDSMGATSGGGSYDHGYGINLTKKLKPFIFHADFIYSFPIKTRVDGIKTRYANYINGDFGIELFLPKGLNLMIECNAFMQGDRKADGEFVPASDVRYLNIVPGIGWSNSMIQTLLAYQRTIAGTNTDVNDSILFTLVYTF